MTVWPDKVFTKASEEPSVCMCALEVEGAVSSETAMTT